MEWDPLKRDVLLYSLVLKAKDSPPIGITELISNDQHEYEISILFPRLLARYQSFVSTTFHTKPSALPFTAVIIDMSWAMTNALLKEMVGMSLISYLQAAIRAKEENLVRFSLILWCYAHFLHAICPKIASLVPVKKRKFSPARRCFKFGMAEMARRTNVEDAVEIFKAITILFSSKMYTEQVNTAVSTLALK